MAGITEAEKMFDPNVVNAAETPQVEGMGLRQSSDSVTQFGDEDTIVGPGGLYGISRETAQRMGPNFLRKDSVFGWVPNDDAAFDDK